MNIDACKPVGEGADAPNVVIRQAYAGVRCMCVVTGCRAGPGCPHYCEHCKQHIAAVEKAVRGEGAV
jgi:hypothetical protein